MRRKILVVDDSAELLRAIARNLRRAGYAVFTARNGADAIKRAQRVLPDLIILDLLLPDVDGYSVCETLRRLPATNAIRILMITGMPGELPRYAGFEAGAVGFIRKPFEWNGLLESTREALNSPSAVPKIPPASETPVAD